jgi:hypothetical protein
MWFERTHYGEIKDDQKEAIRPFVRGRVVTDLGAFQLAYSHMLLELGAKAVIAVDKEYPPESYDKRITCVTKLFKDYRAPIDVAFISWPANYGMGLPQCITDAKKIIVISKNTDGTGCATPAFYTCLLYRKLLTYVPHRKNCLIVVGRKLKNRREMTGEERAGIQINKFTTYDESEALESRCTRTG